MAFVKLLHTFISGIAPASVGATVSGLGNRLFKTASLVSAPVFFIFGEPRVREAPSLKEEMVLILCSYVLRVKCGDSLNESLLPSGAAMPFVYNGLEGNLLSVSVEDVSKVEENSLVRGNSKLTFARFV